MLRWRRARPRPRSASRSSGSASRSTSTPSAARRWSSSPRRRRQERRQDDRQIFPGGALGGDLPAISALRGGTIDATATATSTLVGLVKEFALFDLPFLFQSDAEAMAVARRRLRQARSTRCSDERASSSRLLGRRLPQSHQQPPAGHEARGRQGPEDPGAAEPALCRPLERARRQRRADAVPGGLFGARAEDRRRAGEPVRRR